MIGLRERGIVLWLRHRVNKCHSRVEVRCLQTGGHPCNEPCNRDCNELCNRDCNELCKGHCNPNCNSQRAHRKFLARKDNS
jgi:hypothetical protein